MGQVQAHATHGRRSEAGASMVEILVAVLAFGVLVGFGLMRAHQASSDAAAKERARQALRTQESFYTDRGLWGQAADIQPLEPSLQFLDLDLTGPQVLGKVYVKVDGDVATLVSRSASGTCYWVRKTTATGTTFADVPCTTTPADADFASAW